MDAETDSRLRRTEASFHCLFNNGDCSYEEFEDAQWLCKELRAAHAENDKLAAENERLEKAVGASGADLDDINPED